MELSWNRSNYIFTDLMTKCVLLMQTIWAVWSACGPSLQLLYQKHFKHCGACDRANFFAQKFLVFFRCEISHTYRVSGWSQKSAKIWIYGESPRLGGSNNSLKRRTAEGSCGPIWHAGSWSQCLCYKFSWQRNWQRASSETSKQGHHFFYPSLKHYSGYKSYVGNI